MDWDDRLRTVNWVDLPVANARPATSSEQTGGRPRSTQDQKREDRESRTNKKGASNAAAQAAAAAAEAAERERNEEEMRRKMNATNEVPRPTKKKVRERKRESVLSEL